jgi:hypothetical protein
MLEGFIIAKLLDEKWSTYAQGFFMKRLMVLILSGGAPEHAGLIKWLMVLILSGGAP